MPDNQTLSVTLSFEIFFNSELISVNVNVRNKKFVHSRGTEKISVTDLVKTG